MSTITLHNESENQLKLIEALLKELNIKFEVSKKEKLTDWQQKQLQEGIDQANRGEFFTEDEAEKILDKCFNKMDKKGFAIFSRNFRILEYS